MTATIAVSLTCPKTCSGTERTKCLAGLDPVLGQVLKVFYPKRPVM
jgi:hypothetical protein